MELSCGWQPSRRARHGLHNVSRGPGTPINPLKQSPHDVFELLSAAPQGCRFSDPHRLHGPAATHVSLHASYHTHHTERRTTEPRDHSSPTQAHMRTNETQSSLVTTDRSCCQLAGIGRTQLRSPRSLTSSHVTPQWGRRARSRTLFETPHMKLPKHRVSTITQ